MCLAVCPGLNCPLHPHVGYCSPPGSVNLLHVAVRLDYETKAKTEEAMETTTEITPSGFDNKGMSEAMQRLQITRRFSDHTV